MFCVGRLVPTNDLHVDINRDTSVSHTKSEGYSELPTMLLHRAPELQECLSSVVCCTGDEKETARCTVKSDMANNHRVTLVNTQTFVLPLAVEISAERSYHCIQLALLTLGVQSSPL